MTSKIEVSNIEMRTYAPGVYALTARVQESGRRPMRVMFSTDVSTGEVWVSDEVMRGPRAVVEPKRYGPRLGSAWVREYYDRMGALPSR